MTSTEDGADLVERSTRIMPRPLANPLPLGFLALAVATTLVSCRQLGWLTAGIVGLALAALAG